MVKVIHVVGARPNFMKVSPVLQALAEIVSLEQTLVHTGQHYDTNMSDVFFRQLGIPEPDVNLGIGSGTHAQQTAQVMMAFEPVVLEKAPDLVLVYGDVNSTLAAALVCSKLQVAVGHVEAGLRSGDRTMPEEVNRVLTDQLADLLFTPSLDGNENLAKEGIPGERVHFVGNVMIDTLIRSLPFCRKPSVSGLPSRYALVTLHRPSNVDNAHTLREIVEALAEISEQIPILFAIHPRTRKMLESSPDAGNACARLQMLEPLGYLEFLYLQKHASMVITDSGGIQEETTYLGVPCLTIRPNTERWITVEAGSNLLVGTDMNRLREEVFRILRGEAKKGGIPPLWDGKAAERIATILETHFDCVTRRVGK
jgi:UDP-N-acetylglucosamine 2-epimerase (non-hydrolysing)